MGFLSKLFGGKKSSASTIEGLLEETLQGIIERAGLDLSFDVKVNKENKDILFDLYGGDESIAKSRDGEVLDAFQLLLKRVSQHNFKEERRNLIVDCDGFRMEADQNLVELADRLKGVALKKKKPVYFRALPPRERKIIHQHLSEDKRVKSRSVGEGLFKKIKVSPAFTKEGGKDGDKPSKGSGPKKGPKGPAKKSYNAKKEKSDNDSANA